MVQLVCTTPEVPVYLGYICAETLISLSFQAGWIQRKPQASREAASMFTLERAWIASSPCKTQGTAWYVSQLSFNLLSLLFIVFSSTFQPHSFLNRFSFHRHRAGFFFQGANQWLVPRSSDSLEGETGNLLNIPSIKLSKRMDEANTIYSFSN